MIRIIAFSCLILNVYVLHQYAGELSAKLPDALKWLQLLMFKNLFLRDTECLCFCWSVCSKSLGILKELPWNLTEPEPENIQNEPQKKAVRTWPVWALQGPVCYGFFEISAWTGSWNQINLWTFQILVPLRNVAFPLGECSFFPSSKTSSLPKCSLIPVPILSLSCLSFYGDSLEGQVSLLGSQRLHSKPLFGLVTLML